MTLSELRTRVWDRLAEDSSDPDRYPAATVLEYLNDGIQHFGCRVGHEWATTTITQTANQFWYDLPSDLVRVGRVVWADATSPRKVHASNSLLLDMRDGLTARWEQDTDVRAHTYMLFGLTEIGLYPNITSGTQSYTLHYVKDPGYSELSADTDVPVMPVESHRALVEYAVARCYLADGMVKDAAPAMARWMAAVRTAKSKTGSGDRAWGMN